MSTLAVSKLSEKIPTLFDDFFRPWNEWLDAGAIGRMMNVPAVNITEEGAEYIVSMAAPGFKKNDFTIDVEDNTLTISSRKEEKKEERDKKFTRKEYNYTSFCRSFHLPAEINQDKIDAKYEDGILKISLPRKEEAKKIIAKHISVN